MKIVSCKPKMSFLTFLFLSIILVGALPLTIFASSPTDKQSLNYIASFQDSDTGGLKEEYVDDPQPLETDWGIMAFSAAGYDSSTVGAPKSLIDFAKSDACALSSLTDIERRAIALESAGVDTHTLDGCNLPQEIIDATQSSGQIGDGLVSTVFGVLALSASDENVLTTTIAYLENNQDENGGWDSGWGVESNFTAQTIMALASSGQTISPAIFANAKSYLKNLQTDSGGIRYDGGEWSTESDAFSDSYALQAIYSLKENPDDPYWLENGNTILQDLESLRNDDGSFSFNGSYGKMNPVWTTSSVLIALWHDFLPMHTANLKSWVDEIPSPSPTPTLSVSPSPTPLPSVPPSPVASATPIQSSTLSSEQTITRSVQLAVVSSATQIKPVETSVVASPKPTPEGTKLVSESPETRGKVLSNTASQLKSIWRWIIIIAIFSAFTGVVIAFIEHKYVKNKK